VFGSGLQDAGLRLDLLFSIEVEGTGRRIGPKGCIRTAEDLVIPADRADHPGAERRPGKLTMDLTGLTGILKTSAQDFPTQLDNLVVPRPCRDWFNSLGSP